MEGGGGEEGPDEASEGEGDDVAAVGLWLGDEVEKQGGSGEADEAGDGGADDLGAVGAAVGTWRAEERERASGGGRGWRGCRCGGGWRGWRPRRGR